MAILYAVKKGNALVPVNASSQSVLDKLPAGTELRINAVRDRSDSQNGLAFVLFGLLADALNDGPGAEVWDQDRVRRNLLVATGYADIMPLGPRQAKQWGSRIAVIPKSMNFNSMDGREFSKFFDAALLYVRDVIAPWIAGAPQWPEIEDIVKKAWLPEDAK